MQKRKKFIGISVGDTFSHFEDLKKTIDRVQNESEVLLYMRDSVTLKGAVKKRPRVASLANPDLMYHSILYICAFGKRDNHKAVTRKSTTPKILQGRMEKCKAEIKVGLSDDFQLLEVRRIVDVHNHEISEKVFGLLSEHRSLQSWSPKYRFAESEKKKSLAAADPPGEHSKRARKNYLVKYIENVEEALSTLQMPPSCERIRPETKSLKNLNALKRKQNTSRPTISKQPTKIHKQNSQDFRPSYDYFSLLNDDLSDNNDDDEEYESDIVVVKKQLGKRVEFKKFVEELYKVYGAVVEVHEDRMNPRAIYFQTVDMRNTFAAYPEVLVINASYEIENLGLSLYVVMNTDGNGQAVIVSLWFVTQKSSDNLLYLITRFKEFNPDWESVTVVISDKEICEQNLLMAQMPEAITFVSYFHAINNFRREIYTTKDIGFECEEEKQACLKIIKKMILAKNQEVYSFHFERLKLYSPPIFFEYFMNNWHAVQDQWVDGLKNPFAYFLDQKNNRLEAISQIVKSVCDNFQTVPQFFHDLMKSISSLKLERKQRALIVPVKGPVITSEFHIAEMQYKNLLTPYAYSFVKRQLHFSPKVKIHFNLNDEMSAIKSAKYGELVTSISCCPCVFNTVTGLPCSHIFAVRKDKGVSTYDSSICKERWTLPYLRRTHDLPGEESNLVPDALFGYGETPPSTPHSNITMSEVIEESPSEADEAPFVPAYASSNNTDNVNVEKSYDIDKDDHDEDESSILQQIMKMRRESSEKDSDLTYFGLRQSS